MKPSQIRMLRVRYVLSFIAPRRLVLNWGIVEAVSRAETQNEGNRPHRSVT